MRRVLIADPRLALPRLEQRTEVRRRKDANAGFLGHAPKFINRFCGVGQMLHDVLDDDHVERAILIRQFLSGCSLQGCGFREFFGFVNRPVIQIHAVRFKLRRQLPHQMTRA